MYVHPLTSYPVVAGQEEASNKLEDLKHKWKCTRNGGGRGNGYFFPTFKAAIFRNGVFTSKIIGEVNLNYDISKPMHAATDQLWTKPLSLKALDVWADDCCADISACRKRFLSAFTIQFYSEVEVLTPSS